MELKAEKQHAHGDWVNSVAFSPDGKTIVSGANDSMLKVWDADGLTPKLATELQLRPKLATAHKPKAEKQSARIVSGSNDKTFNVRDTAVPARETRPHHSGYDVSLDSGSSSNYETEKYWYNHNVRQGITPTNSYYGSGSGFG